VMIKQLLTSINRLSGLLIASALSTSVYASTGSGAVYNQGANAFAKARAYSDESYKQPVLINFGVYSDARATSVVRTYMPALKSLERSMTIKLGAPVDIRMHIAQDKEQGLDHLINRDVDFTAVDTQDFLEMKESGIDLRILVAQNKTNTNRLSPLVTRAGLDDRVHDALKDSLLNLDNKKILSRLHLFGFVQSNESQYEQSNQLVPAANNSATTVEFETTTKKTVHGENTQSLKGPILGAANTDSHDVQNTPDNLNQTHTEGDISISIAIPRALLKQAERTNQSSVNVVVDLNAISTPATNSYSID